MAFKTNYKWNTVEKGASISKLPLSDITLAPPVAFDTKNSILTHGNLNHCIVALASKYGDGAGW